MSQSFVEQDAPLGASMGQAFSGATTAEPPPLPLAGRYALSLLLVVLATVLAFVMRTMVATPSLTLLYVLPVVIAAVTLGWGPSLAAAVAGVLAFDYFFAPPLYSFRIASPSDLWATGMLLVIATIISTLAAEARRRAVEARRAAEQAQALQALAHVVVQARPQAEVIQAAATALNGAFRAPSVIFGKRNGGVTPLATAGKPEITEADEAAALGALDSRLPTRAETYPYDQAEFDFWPVVTPTGARAVLGVDFGATGRDRPDKPERLVEIVGAYVAISLGREA
ncbi:MAG TPA: DUF4118 domain-containing protein [Phenylobacterium sp.]|nr:DUF4118 domain-containing protein [Phenylobacterium sp.]